MVFTFLFTVCFIANELISETEYFKRQKTDDKIYVCKISKKCFLQAIVYQEFKGSNSVDLDEAAHYDLCCLKIRLLILSVVAVKHFPVHNHSAYNIFSGPLGPLDSV